MKRKFDLAFSRIGDLVAEADPEGLLALGAPLMNTTHS
jgi:hypothetical protein